MLIALTGKNSYMLRRRLDELMAGFAKKYGDLALEKLDGSEVEPQVITDAVVAMPFLAQRKMVVVRDLSRNQAAAEAIEQIISSIPVSTDLVIYEPDIDRRSAYFKVLKAQTTFEEFGELDARQLAKWLVDSAKTQGGQLTLADANYLVERLGPNQSLLANELDKLLTYDLKISRQSIDLLTEPNPQSRIFDLLDAAFKQDKRRALKLYDEQRAQKVDPQAILAMLAWQLRLLSIAKHMGQRPPSTVAKELGISEYPLRKASDLAAKIDEKRLKTLVEEALTLDVRTKTSAVDLDEALKTYITTL